MPHQCTNCGRTFADGSKEMLSGCPDCGGNKFQFDPDGGSDTAPPETEDTTDRTASTVSSDEPSANDVAGTNPDDVAGTNTSSRTAPDTEDGAQASARSDVVSPDELAAAAESTEPVTDRTEQNEVSSSADDADSADTEDSDPNLDALRQKLNDQFESIRIVSPGQYELNLMELYDREEYIISLREDGRYVIEMPEGWDDR
ncbi:Zn-ribbon domain-containing protein [Halobaculum rubrum]|uniref:Zn-ribbon domain-containing protein n=1 Tax=Halobaculum rubrum TaxID=2872158 RepID=UPI001CA41A4F|nr:Zn-ribbon domain-containing protein [Halobaculum rubrum]QZY00869.1 Zn-ribbon domain-containing protein [Halobaculum rubrum]